MQRLFEKISKNNTPVESADKRISRVARESAKGICKTKLDLDLNKLDRKPNAIEKREAENKANEEFVQCMRRIP